VSVLFCEGGNNSPDVRLLGAILRGTGVLVLPSGGKDGFSNLIRGWRRQDPRACGIVDGDFPRRPEAWSPSSEPGPRTWIARHDDVEVMLGWTWQRKEVENYFLDPDVLARAFRWGDAKKRDYIERLEGVFDTLGYVTAARMALTACAPRKKRVETRLGLDLGPDRLKEVLRSRAREYSKDAILDEDELIEAFERHAPDCLPGGRFRQHALEVFAGRNVFAKIEQTSGFAPELKNPEMLQEIVLEALVKDAFPHTWLPEWTALRSAVEIWTPRPEA
jgi:hypothetical protein